ncbi:MAG: BPSL0067 family protein [Cyanosarcina radialis HA8281-LM2]|jgi:hypothetical protein|nr:BPSL0067 family protein [Cyanosarcina radialis HA8281-LM2]
MRSNLSLIRSCLLASSIAIGTSFLGVDRTFAAVLKITDTNLERINLQNGGWKPLNAKLKYLPWENCEVGKYCGKDIDAPFKRRYKSQFTKLADSEGYFWGECVSFVKALSKSSFTTHQWRRGQRLVDAIREGNIEEGTAIATFPRGRYHGHAAFYAGSDISLDGKIDYVWLYSQNWGLRRVLYHKIDGTGSGPGNFNNYYIIRVPKASS